MGAEVLLGLQREVLQAMARRDSLSDVLEAICQLVEDAVQPGVCSVMRIDPRSGRLFFVAAPCVPPDAQDALNALEPGELSGSCGTAFHTKEIVIVADTRTDPRWASLRDFVRSAGLLSCWSVPILCGSEALGTFAISRPVTGSPTEDELVVLRTASQMAGIAIDRDRAHAELDEQRALLLSMIEATEDPVFVKDEHLRYRLVNSAEAAGVRDDPEEMIGQTDAELYPDLAPECTRVDREILASGQGQLYEEDYDNRLHGVRTFLIRKNPILDEQGRATGIVGIARDITALKRTEEALRRAQKLESLGVLAGGVAHDFNNILTGILGNAHFLLDERRAALDAGTRACLVEIEKAARRASELTDQMLAYAGHGQLTKEVIALPQIVEEVTELLASSISKRAELVFEIDDDLPAIEAAPTQIRQVVMNVLTNASEALEGRSGTIRVRMSRRELDGSEADAFDVQPGRFVLLEVADDGVGMTAETAERMFDPFFSTKFDGRGLGLAAVQGIVSGHGGGIAVESLTGRGTRVRVVLPASAERPAKSSNERAPSRAPSPGGHVLVVEDEPAVRDLIRAVLEQEGYTVTLCEDGQEAVDRLAGADPIDVILLDLTTPRLSGPEVVEALERMGVSIPILLTSGYGPLEAQRGFPEGAISGFLQKPFRPNQLAERIAEVARR